MSLDGLYDPENIFAKVIRGDAAAVKVHETADVLAFMDIFPQSEGHTLVVSKTSKARNILDIDPEDLSTVIHEVKRVAAGVRAALNPDGIVLMQFNGAPAGQTVFHLHFHIIPRWADRPIAPHAQGQMADLAALQSVGERIAAAILSAA